MLRCDVINVMSPAVDGTLPAAVSSGESHGFELGTCRTNHKLTENSITQTTVATPTPRGSIPLQPHPLPYVHQVNSSLHVCSKDLLAM